MRSTLEYEGIIKLESNIYEGDITMLFTDAILSFDHPG